ncbi:MAG: serine/threonine-protein phosphatase [Oligoflexia bacterium]|nr:serine/threonine-protein phosphatase [Oligoflexia bacterium]
MSRSTWWRSRPAPWPQAASFGLALWLELERAHATAKLREAAPPRTNLALDLGHDTHIGAIKSRLGQTNQDALFFHQHGPLTLLLVADGISISTAGSGNLASALLVQAVAARWEAQADSLINAEDARIFEFQRRALEDGNTAVCQAAYSLADGDLDNCIPMGTTAVMATIRGGVAYLSSVGDSRIYLIGRDGCALLTSDGNLRGDWILAWQGGHPITMDQDGAALTSYVGHFDEAGQPAALPPAQRAVSLLPGEHLLLCTDGLTDFAAPDPGELCALIEDTLDSAISVGQACRELVAAANAGGGGDNITVMLARLPG